jgi:hypothetical protein
LELKNIRLDGVTTQVAMVDPGATVTMTFDWQIHNDSNYCPGCIQQIITGWAGQEAAYCISVGRGSAPGNSGTNRNAVLTVPSEPGTYYVAYRSDLQYNCDRTYVLTNNFKVFVAAVCVR